jgi:hypothetical protein
MKSALVSFVALVFLGTFVAVWMWIAYDLWQFEPSGSTEALEVDEKVVDVAGFLAATVGAGTAAFLGIEIQKRPDNMSLKTWVSTKLARAVLLISGVVAYLAVGGVVFALWLTTTDETPDFINAFAWGILGWAAGAFSAAFAGKE